MISIMANPFLLVVYCWFVLFKADELETERVQLASDFSRTSLRISSESWPTVPGWRGHLFCQLDHSSGGGG